MVAKSEDGPANGSRAKAPKPKKLKRAEKAELTRQAICDAAAEIIGEYGYAEASIARIMERAGLGHGTFYAYFESRAELFDQLLPIKGREALDYIQERVKGASDLIDMDTRGLRAFLDYARARPWFFRLLHEAETAAPDAYRVHLDQIMSRFRRSLKRSWDRGELPGYKESELDTIAYMLIATRDYVYSLHASRSSDIESALDEAVETYRKFVRFGLQGQEPR